jgi:hypothetical protein
MLVGPVVIQHGLYLVTIFLGDAYCHLVGINV